MASYVEVLKEVYQLAVERNKKEKQYQIKNEKSTVDFSEIIERQEDSALLQYLNSLDINALKMIQTVMYIGRDYIVPEFEEDLEEECEDRCDDVGESRYFPVSNPNGLIMAWLEYFDGMIGWQDKHIEIDQIYSKSPLDIYLKRAFEILGI